MIKDDFSSDNMDLIFEEIMNSGVISSEFDERLSKESLLSEKLDDLKIVTKQASDMEKDFLLSNIDYLINIMSHNRDFKYYRSELNESLLDEKINNLQMLLKVVNDLELDLLISNVNYLIHVMMQNDRVRRDYEYRKELRKTI